MTLAFCVSTLVLTLVMRSSAEPLLNVCIDDSDCRALGRQYRCVAYLCYPWEDDTIVPPEERHQFCNRNSECKVGEKCIRHYNFQVVPRGLCFDNLPACFDNNDCPSGQSCCGSFCCQDSYYWQFLQLPCISDLQCNVRFFIRVTIWRRYYCSVSNVITSNTMPYKF